MHHIIACCHVTLPTFAKSSLKKFIFIPSSRMFLPPLQNPCLRKKIKKRLLLHHNDSTTSLWYNKSLASYLHGRIYSIVLTLTCHTNGASYSLLQEWIISLFLPFVNIWRLIFYRICSISEPNHKSGSLMKNNATFMLRFCKSLKTTLISDGQTHFHGVDRPSVFPKFPTRQSLESNCLYRSV